MTETILIADDHPLFRQALALAVGRVRPQARIVEAGTLAAAARAVTETVDLALVILDLKMPGAVGYSGIALLAPEILAGWDETIFPLREPLRRAATHGALGGECWEGEWEDVGTVERYRALNRRLEQKQEQGGSAGPAI